jgi:hypothetical protein
MRTGRIKLRSCKDTKCYMHCKRNWKSAYILFVTTVWMRQSTHSNCGSERTQTDTSHEDPHAFPNANHQTFIEAEMVGTELHINTKHIPNVRHPRSLTIWKTHKTKPNTPNIYAMRTFLCFIHLQFRSLRHAPHSRQRTAIYDYHSGCLPFEHWNSGSGPHSRGRCASAPYLPLYCPL